MKRSQQEEKNNRMAGGGWCGKCGKTKHHNKEKCPAAESECQKCKKKGHWERMCYSRPVNEVTLIRGTHTQASDDDSWEWGYLGTVSKTGGDVTENWFVKLNVQGSQVKFKIDTGADVTVMNEETFNLLGSKVKLSQTHAMIDMIAQVEG